MNGSSFISAARNCLFSCKTKLVAAISCVAWVGDGFPCDVSTSAEIRVLYGAFYWSFVKRVIREALLLSTGQSIARAKMKRPSPRPVVFCNDVLLFTARAISILKPKASRDLERVPTLHDLYLKYIFDQDIFLSDMTNVLKIYLLFIHYYLNKQFFFCIFFSNPIKHMFGSNIFEVKILQCGWVPCPYRYCGRGQPV